MTDYNIVKTVVFTTFVYLEPFFAVMNKRINAKEKEYSL